MQTGHAALLPASQEHATNASQVPSMQQNSAARTDAATKNSLPATDHLVHTPNVLALHWRSMQQRELQMRTFAVHLPAHYMLLHTTG